jgi:hypothetical protein
LLFGPTSETGKRASDIERAFEKLRAAFVDWDSGAPGGEARTEAAATEVGERVNRFTAASRREIRFGIFTNWISI